MKKIMKKICCFAAAAAAAVFAAAAAAAGAGIEAPKAEGAARPPLKKEALSAADQPDQPPASRPQNLKKPAGEASGGRGPAEAESSARPRRRFVELGLEYPLAFGLHGKYMLSDQWHIRAGAGFMAEFFLSGFSKIMPYTGYLEEAEIQLISDILKNSLCAEIRLGWAPYFKEGGGPYLELGLSHASYGKGEVRGSVFNEAGGFGDDMDEESLYSAKTNILSGSLHLGYQIPFERLRLNLELGLLKILKAEASQIRATTRAPGRLSSRQRQRLNRFLEKKGWIAPTFSIWLGFAF